MALVRLLGIYFMFEIRKNLDLRKTLGVTNIFLKSRFVCSAFMGTLTFSKEGSRMEHLRGRLLSGNPST